MALRSPTRRCTPAWRVVVEQAPVEARGRAGPRPVPVIPSGETFYAACRETSGRAEKRAARLRQGAVSSSEATTRRPSMTSSRRRGSRKVPSIITSPPRRRCSKPWPPAWPGRASPRSGTSWMMHRSMPWAASTPFWGPRQMKVETAPKLGPVRRGLSPGEHRPVPPAQRRRRRRHGAGAGADHRRRRGGGGVRLARPASHGRDPPAVRHPDPRRRRESHRGFFNGDRHGDRGTGATTGEAARDGLRSILGVPDGSVRLVEPGFARAVMSAGDGADGPCGSAGISGDTGCRAGTPASPQRPVTWKRSPGLYLYGRHLRPVNGYRGRHPVLA